MKTLNKKSSSFYSVLTLAFLGWIVFGSCQSNGGSSGSVKIEATFPSCQADSLQVFYVDGFMPRRVMGGAKESKGDNAVYAIAGDVPGPGLYLVGQAPNNLRPVLLGPERKLTLSGNCANLGQYGKVEDSPLNADYETINRRFFRLDQQMNMANQKLQAGLGSNNPGLVNSARSEVIAAYQAQKILVDSLAEEGSILAKAFAPFLYEPFDPENPGAYADPLSHFAGEAFANVNMADPVYNYLPTLADRFAIYVRSIFSGQLPIGLARQRLDSALAKVPEGSLARKNALAKSVIALDQAGSTVFIDYATMYSQRYAPELQVQQYLDSRIAQYRAKAEADKKLAIGAVPPEIDLPTPEGDNLRLSELKGKVVLLDFWASWCKPCRMENPNVVRVYNRYKSKGFDILSVSLDRDRANWLKAIEDDKMDWHHVSDLKFWQSKAAKDYNVTAIPATFLLDQEGRIIAKNLRGPALEAKIKEVLGT